MLSLWHLLLEGLLRSLEVPAGHPERPPSRRDRAQALVVAKVEPAEPQVPQVKSMYTKEVWISVA